VQQQQWTLSSASVSLATAFAGSTRSLETRVEKVSKKLCFLSRGQKAAAGQSLPHRTQIFGAP